MHDCILLFSAKTSRCRSYDDALAIKITGTSACAEPPTAAGRADAGASRYPGIGQGAGGYRIEGTLRIPIAINGPESEERRSGRTRPATPQKVGSGGGI